MIAMVAVLAMIAIGEIAIIADLAGSGDGPGVAGEDHVAEGGEAFAGAHFLGLAGYFLVVDGGGDVADYTDGEGEGLAVHHGELLVEEV